MYSKIISTLILITASHMLFAQASPKDRWKETKRTDRKNVAVAYKDTMQITGVKKDSLQMRKGSFLYPGLITNDLLDMGYDQYQIIKISATEIKLGDPDYIHIFTKEAIDTSNNSITRSMQNMAAPLKQVTSIDTTALKGSWQAYSKKKKDAANTNPINYKTMITKLTFSGRNAQNGYGNVSTGSGDSYTIAGVSGGNISLKDATGKTSSLIVYKVSKEELIVEDASGLLYYMKQF